MSNKKKRGIEPLIAAVILVAVAIALAVAVAFWLTGIVGGYTKYEQLEVSTAYADWNEDNQTWVVVLQVKNTGSSDSTLDEIFVNGRPHDAYASIPDTGYGYVTGRVSVTAKDLKMDTDGVVYLKYNDTKNVTVDVNNIKKFDFTNGVPLKSGDEITIIILIKGPGHDWPNGGGNDFKHGATVEFKIHTSAGRDYPKSITLP